MDLRRAVRLLFFACAGALAIAAAPWHSAPAGAGTDDQPRLISSRPANGAVLNATPIEIVLQFDKRLPAGPISLVLQNAANEPQSLRQVITQQNRSVITAGINNLLAVGRYRVTYRVAAESGPPLTGSFTFELQAPSGATTGTDLEATDGATDALTDDTGTAGTDAISAAGGGESSTSTPATQVSSGSGTGHYAGFVGVLARTLAFIGIAAIFGALVVMAVTWAEGVEYVNTVQHLRICWVVGLVGSLFTLAAATADASGDSLFTSLLPTKWFDELFDVTLGKVLLIRLAAIVACVWIVNRPERVVEPGSQLMGLAVPAIGLATYGWSRTGTDVNVVAIPAGAVHALSAAAWFGGAALLTHVVLAGPGESDVVHALRGFRRIGVPAMLLTILSGAVQTVLFLGGLGKLATTTYGRIFVLKVIAAMLMAFVATANRQYIRARLGRTDHLAPRPAHKLHKSVRTEVLAGAAALLFASWLVTTPSPRLTEPNPVTGRRDTYSSADGAFTVRLKMSPTQVGQNTEFHFDLLEPTTVSDAVVTLRPVDNKSNGIEIPIPENTPQYGFDAEQGFTFGTSGEWNLTVSGSGPNGRLQDIRATFVVRNADGSLPLTTTTVPAGATSTSPTTTVPPTSSTEE
jgi:copper transport protein